MNIKYSREFKLPEQIEIINYLNTIQFTGYYKTINNIETISVDQKTTFDILNLNCKCILSLNLNENNLFTVNDLFTSNYSQEIFKENTLKNGKALISAKTSKEYDKVFGNVLDTLSYAEILEKKKIKGKKYFTIKNRYILEKLAYSLESCSAFICHFVFLLIKDCKNITDLLIAMSKDKNYTKNHEEQLKKEIQNWIYQSSNKRRNKDRFQISLKILNPLLYIFNLWQFKKREEQTLFNLSYIRKHKRDKKKISGYTRKEMKEFLLTSCDSNDSKKYRDSSNVNKEKVKVLNKIRNGGDKIISELELDCLDITDCCSVHHIWPISWWIGNEKKWKNYKVLDPNMFENLIVISNNEHSSIAHHKQNTKLLNIDKLKFILSKQHKKIKSNQTHYKLKNFYVLSCYIMKYEVDEKYNNYSDELISYYIDNMINDFDPIGFYKK